MEEFLMTEDSNDIYADINDISSMKKDNENSFTDKELADLEKYKKNKSENSLRDTISLDSSKSIVSHLDELNLKQKEMELYSELVEVEQKSKEFQAKRDLEYEDLQQEVKKLRTIIVEKDAKISELTKQNINLKKNICSLYKTAKSEIEHKDYLIREANEKLDYIYFRRCSNFNVQKESSKAKEDKMTISSDESTKSANKDKGLKKCSSSK